MKKNLLYFLLLFYGLLVGQNLKAETFECSSPFFALELKTRTSCMDSASEQACSIVNTSRLFKKDPSAFIVFATLENPPSSELNSLSPSIDVNAIHEAVRQYNHGLENHKSMISFSKMLNKTPKEFLEMTAKKNLSKTNEAGESVAPSEEAIQTEVRRVAKGVHEYYNREVLSARAAVYKELGINISDEVSFQRIREAEDFIRAWRQARRNSTRFDKTFEPSKNSGVKQAFTKLLNTGLVRKTLGAKKIKLRGTGVTQNIALGAFELIDPGSIKKLDLQRLRCPKETFKSYDQITDRDAKSLVQIDHCRMLAQGEDLDRLITEYLPTIEPDHPLCQLLSDQLVYLRNEQMNQPYRSIEVPQVAEEDDSLNKSSQ